MDPGLGSVRVWDLPTRVFHWLLAAAVVFSVASAKVGGNAMVWHFRCGYLIFALLAFRIIWGFVGGRWSRFASFVYAPRTLARYLRGDVRPAENLDVGHSPLGALSVFAMLAFLAAQVGTGLFADDEIANAGPMVKFVSGATSSLATAWHKQVGQGVVIVLAIVHVGAVLYYRFAKRRNLILPMLVGDKALPTDTPASADRAATRVAAAALVAACGAAVAWLVSLGA